MAEGSTLSTESASPRRMRFAAMAFFVAAACFFVAAMLDRSDSLRLVAGIVNVVAGWVILLQARGGRERAQA